MSDQSHLTLLMEFHVIPMDSSIDEGLAASVLQVLEKHLGQSTEVYRKQDADMVTIIRETVASNTRAGRSLITIRIKSSGLVLINVDLTAEDGASFDTLARSILEEEVRQCLKPVKGKALCPIRRGGSIDLYRYSTSFDGRFLEQDVFQVVADVQSEYQQVAILNTGNFGNILVLDGLQNLAESDLIYTESLMQRGKIDYTGKDILLLGAGDGALLWELLKENPNKVTMVEIDDTVMLLCRQHLRLACGTALDSYTGPHHEVIVGSCFEELDRYAETGQKFDYIFGDLTDTPLSSDTQSEEWQFLTNVICKSFKVLRPSGRFLTHGSGVNCADSIALFESHLKSLQEPSVQFTRCHAFVPSFLEDWSFYQIWRSDEE